MSRVGKQPVLIPEGVTFSLEGKSIKVVGPKGEVNLNMPNFIEVEKKDNQVLVKRRFEDKKTKSNHGTIRSLIANMVKGVVEGWQKELEVVGTGFRVDLTGRNLTFKLGFSHPVVFEAPEGITFEVVDNKIKVFGADKELVGNTAAKLRKIKKPDAYQGKGIRYADEVVKLKPGKAAKVGSAA